jgi:hypothetical protein
MRLRNGIDNTAQTGATGFANPVPPGLSWQ